MLAEPYRPESGGVMAARSRRTNLPKLKAKVTPVAIVGDRTVLQFTALHHGGMYAV